MAELRAEAGQPSSQAVPTTDAQTGWAAAIVAVVTAAITVGLFSRLSHDARWAPFLGWLVAGIVVGAIERHRLGAIKVAGLTTLGASLVTGLMAWFVNRPQHTAQKIPAINPPPTVNEVIVMTFVCSLAAVLGAAAVSEFYRWREEQA